MTAAADFTSYRTTVYDCFTASILILSRLWITLVAIPAGILLSVLLMTNDFSVGKVAENVMFSSHEALQALQPGAVAGTYRWTECVDARKVSRRMPPPPVAAEECKERISHEGTLSEALAPGADFIGYAYGFLSLISFVVMLGISPRSSFALRAKLAGLLRMNRS
ncbi:hypothetical protein [Pseudomonas sp. MWU12-2323]|uniref:hypothetical protein n=1 Tax=Pseudomonas sp. MWU12-2323 TaxID=2651296 RepID=UPI00128C8F6A|nr:hypothetical protein [Pseudomonas sp. MWU12-2323]MPQ69354.1 hypothetical protein [Pseudomonas sp. MWU12-2323]